MNIISPVTDSSFSDSLLFSLLLYYKQQRVNYQWRELYLSHQLYELFKERDLLLFVVSLLEYEKKYNSFVNEQNWILRQLRSSHPISVPSLRLFLHQHAKSMINTFKNKYLVFDWFKCCFLPFLLLLTYQICGQFSRVSFVHLSDIVTIEQLENSSDEKNSNLEITYW